eukprot:4793571-Pleurochrysis_carterae.AAC.1
MKCFAVLPCKRLVSQYSCDSHAGDIQLNTKPRVLAAHVLAHLCLARPLCPIFGYRFTKGEGSSGSKRKGQK